MIRFILLAGLIFLLYKIISRSAKSVKPGTNGNSQSRSRSTGGEDLMEDPVCHTYVPVSQAFKKEISGKDYYFCSEKCRDKYTSENH